MTPCEISRFMGTAPVAGCQHHWHKGEHGQLCCHCGLTAAEPMTPLEREGRDSGDLLGR